MPRPKRADFAKKPKPKKARKQPKKKQKGSREYGRNLIITDALRDEMCRFLAKPTPISTTCDIVGISERTYHRWREKGSNAITKLHGDPDAVITDDERPYVEFFYETQLARRKGEVALQNLVMKAAIEGDVRATMWMMERMYKDNWNMVHHHHVSGEVQVETNDRRNFVQQIMGDDTLRKKVGGILDELIANAEEVTEEA